MAHARAKTAARLRDALGVAGSLALVASLGLLVLKGRPTMAQDDSPKAPELCGKWHRGAPGTVRVDLAAARREQKRVRKTVETALSGMKGSLPKKFRGGHTTGLPSCRETRTRTPKIDKRVLRRLASRTLYFLSVADPADVNLPREISENPRAQILITGCRKLSDLAVLAKRLKRPVSLASRKLADSLGIRCVNSWITVLKDGKTVQIHEVD